MKTMQKHSELIAGLSGFIFTILLMIVSGVTVTWFFVDDDRLISGVEIAQIDVSGLTYQETTQKLHESLANPEIFTLTIQKGDQSWASSSAQLGWQPDYSKAIQQAFLVGRSGNLLNQTWNRLHSLWQPVEIPIEYQFDEQKVRSWVEIISQEIDAPGKPPQVLATAYNYEVERGEAGEIVDQAAMFQDILEKSDSTTMALRTITPHQPLTDDQLARSEQRLKQLWGKTISLATAEDESIMQLGAQDFFPWIQLPEGYNIAKMQTQLEEWNKIFARDPQDAQLEIENEKTIKTFQPPLNGRSINLEESERNLIEALTILEDSTDKNAKTQLAFSIVEPAIKLEETNTLGIKERIGLGTSTFFHSIPNRVFNVNLTSQRVNNTLVKPGEDFSFNKVVGEISARTGYKSAYVIRNGRTELGDGGGVCQVSTTVFRAALDAGFPISAWKAHSYRVGYYEQNSQPGFDATVYAPSPDFRFTNNTDHHILITTSVDLENLFMRVEIWGTSDGRESTISDYWFGNVRPAPAPLYQEDPSLPPGTKKQIDWAAAGGTAKFNYTVKNKQGEEMYQRTFTSVYRPWQAVYLVGPTQ